MSHYPAECPAFKWKGQVYEGLPYVWDRTDLVDGDIVLGDDLIFTARQIIEGAGPVPLTKAARRLVRWVQTWRAMYFGVTEDNEGEEGPYNYDFIDEDGCRCRSCQYRERQRQRVSAHYSYSVVNGNWVQV